MNDDDLRIAYMPLDDLLALPRNAKAHAIDKLESSVDRFGFTAPPSVDETSGVLFAGHGRLKVLKKLRDSGEQPPHRVKLAADGQWLIPVLRGVGFDDERELEAYAIADNQLTIAGGWDFPTLRDVLSDLTAEGDGATDGLGFTDAELERILMDSTEFEAIAEPQPGESGEKAPKVCPNCGHSW